MEKQTFTPLLPFDSTHDDHFSIYYPEYYVRDVNLIPPEKIQKESGNIIKFYQCKDTEIRPVGGDKKNPVPKEE